MKPNELNELLTTLRNEVIPTLFPVIGLPTTFTPEGVQKMEDVINEMYPEGHEPLTTTFIPFGFYLGQTIVETIPGAEWSVEDNAQYINDISIVLKDEEGKMSAQVRPFTRIEKFWGDRTDGLSVFYYMIASMEQIKEASENLPEGQWIDLGQGRLRITKIDKDMIN